MKKIRITGSTGFVGRNLIPYLQERGHEVQCIERNELPGITAEGLADTDVVVHLAGKAHDLRSSANPNEYYDVNFELTKKVYDAFLQSDVTSFIFFSSVKSSADEVKTILYEEDVPNPKTDYGKSKLLAEEYIINQVLPIGKTYYILRPCMIHGPGNKGNLNLLYKIVEKGIPYPLASFENRRSFLSIENLNVLMEQLIYQESIPSGIFNLADDEPLSTNQVVTIVGNALGFNARLWKVNKELIKVIASIGDKLSLPLNSERLKKLTESYVVSNQKIKSALKIKHLPVSAANGLLSTIKSFRSI
jgi:nucleoside-diphosphate-sugar epimerase